MDFHSELLNFQEEIARLPKGVRADPAYWINRIKEKSSDELLASFERQVREEVKTGNGGAQYDADHESDCFQPPHVESHRCRMSRNGATQKQNLKQSPALLASQCIVDRLQAWELGGASSL
jgi:hypothetical protein